MSSQVGARGDIVLNLVDTSSGLCRVNGVLAGAKALTRAGRAAGVTSGPVDAPGREALVPITKSLALSVTLSFYTFPNTGKARGRCWTATSVAIAVVGHPVLRARTTRAFRICESPAPALGYGLLHITLGWASPGVDPKAPTSGTA